MPLGFERLNERIRRPNLLINFIKPLPGPDSATAQDFLERIAAITYPIMKENHIAVMSLEEFPSNPEFVGRNFNAGEVIQLVLKSRRGTWLPLRYVEMVMIHELAHCREMNHSRFFWRVRDAYAENLKGLWQKGYTGDGFWGHGRGVQNGGYLTSEVPDRDILPIASCGGTYRRRKGTRKRSTEKPKLSYAERQQKRILKKFGAGGVAVGEDEQIRLRLEQGKSTASKPRVANSARGRELRVAAALARLEKVEKVKKEDEDDEDETDEGSDYDGSEGDVAIGFDGEKMKDLEGHELVRICNGDEDDENIKREAEELMLFDIKRINSQPSEVANPGGQKRKRSGFHSEAKISQSSSRSDIQTTRTLSSATTTTNQNDGPELEVVCKACSVLNPRGSILCSTCSNVLDPLIMVDHWSCQSSACEGVEFINAGDYGRCQLCGEAKPKTTKNDNDG